MCNHTSTSSTDASPSIWNPLKPSFWVWQKFKCLWNYTKKPPFLHGFLITAIVIFGLFAFFIYRANDVVSQGLIFLDYLFSLLIAYFVFKRDINDFIDHNERLVAAYDTSGKNIAKEEIVSGINHNVLLRPTIWFFAFIIFLGLIALIINLTLPDNSFNREHSWYKFLKFGICQFIMINIVFVFSELSTKFYIDNLERNFEILKKLFRV